MNADWFNMGFLNEGGPMQNQPWRVVAAITGFTFVLVACGGGQTGIETSAKTSSTTSLTPSSDDLLLDKAAKLNADELNRASVAERASVAGANSASFAASGMAKISAGTLVPVYRFYIPARNVHFFTANEAEKQLVQSAMTSTHVYEGIAFYASSTPAPGLSPVYRYYNSTAYSTHFYSISTDEQAYIDTHFLFVHEGIAFYASKTAGSCLVGVSRFMQRRYGNHLFTPNVAEAQYIRDNLSSLYIDEGAAFYALDPSCYATTLNLLQPGVFLGDKLTHD